MVTQAYDLTDEDQFIQLVADFAVRDHGLPDTYDDPRRTRFLRNRERTSYETFETNTDSWISLLVAHKRRLRQQRIIAALNRSNPKGPVP